MDGALKIILTIILVIAELFLIAVVLLNQVRVLVCQAV